MTHDCTHHGHVWLETGGTPYTRIRGRSQASVPVTCKHCPATADLPRHAGFSGPRKGHPVDHTIPPAFQKVLERAMSADPPAQVPKQP